MGRIAELGAAHLDALREVANIGAGHATTALSQMTDRRIDLAVPEIHLASREELSDVIAEPAPTAVAVMMQVYGDLGGGTLFILREPDARRLCEFLTLGMRGAPPGSDDWDWSPLLEAGNIVVSAYLNALAALMEMNLMPSVPTLTTGPWTTVIDELVPADDSAIFCASTEFVFSEGDHDLRVRGQVLQLPDRQSLVAMLQALGVEKT